MLILAIRPRQLHAALAPVMLLPVVLTLLTGTFYQIADLGGKAGNFSWLLDWHKGDFGIVNLEAVYPLLNALGLLILAITGILMWIKTRRRSRPHSERV